jgi:hypothetical protein
VRRILVSIMLYVKTAVEHLVAIKRMLRELSNFANLNMTEPQAALYTSMQTLIRESAAYADANEIIKLYKRGRHGRKYH